MTNGNEGRSGEKEQGPGMRVVSAGPRWSCVVLGRFYRGVRDGLRR